MLVRERAAHRCEYCGVSQSADAFFVLHIEHIIARQHGGDDGLENLALACFHCNLRKGPNIAALDAVTGTLVALFHPRRQEWRAHFVSNGEVVEGTTPTGRATVSLLQMNAADRRRVRRLG